MQQVDDRVEDALLLWRSGRPEGAFLLAILAVLLRARQEFRRPMGEAESFRRYIGSQFSLRLSAEYRGKLWSMEDVFYKWFRCEIVHAGGLPVDVGLMPETPPTELRIRAGGAPDYKLLISAGWFHQLIAWARA